eukprot:m.131081 g.131081  ORF g.131081 m.131081 type:complete len:91 (+) comp13913_c0_seq2:753-1025(+)
MHPSTMAAKVDVGFAKSTAYTTIHFRVTEGDGNLMEVVSSRSCSKVCTIFRNNNRNIERQHPHVTFHTNVHRICARTLALRKIHDGVCGS